MGTIIKALNVDDFTTLIICFELSFRSVYKELHADHEMGAADNK